MNQNPLYLTNTLTGTKDPFKTLEPNTVRMYVCGITPYDFAHLGHARVYIIFDVLYRLLLFLGYKVIYCRNFTDIDDKLLERARILHNNPMAYKEVAQKFITAFHEDMKSLGCLSPTHEPLVTDHIPKIIEFIQALVSNGSAYVMEGDVYFDVTKDLDYGHLSRQRLDELQSGARVEVNHKKRSPLDFALWKGESEGKFWASPWGYGRPGWHIECSALAYRYLGPVIDIHGGGADLIFPHHENEIAQTENRTSRMFATFWLHNAFVQINKEKMSKSLGNFFTIKELLQKCDPMVLRFLMLNHHYRSPINFSLDDLISIERSYQRLCTLFENTPTQTVSSQEIANSSVVGEIMHMMLDDLNTVGALGVIFKHSKAIAQYPHEAIAVKHFLRTIFGLSLIPLAAKESAPLTPEIEQLIKEREEARQAKNWKQADEIRQRLIELGFNVQDKKI